MCILYVMSNAPRKDVTLNAEREAADAEASLPDAQREQLEARRLAARTGQTEPDFGDAEDDGYGCVCLSTDRDEDSSGICATCDRWCWHPPQKTLAELRDDAQSARGRSRRTFGL